MRDIMHKSQKLKKKTEKQKKPRDLWSGLYSLN